MAASRAPQRSPRHAPDGSSAQCRLLERLHREHWHRLVAYLTAQTTDPDLAQDLAQDTLVRAAANLDHLDPDKPAWPWLRTIASNLVVDHRRRRRERPVDNLDTRHEPHADPFDRLLDRPTLAQALHALPDRQRVAITLRYVDQWKAAEAAELFGITRPAFEQLLHRARTNLRTRFERLTRTRLAAILLPLYRLKDTLTTRIRARLSTAEQSLNALGPAAFDAMGQAAATIAVLALIVAGAAGDPRPQDSVESAETTAWTATSPTSTSQAVAAPSGAAMSRPVSPAALDRDDQAPPTEGRSRRVEFRGPVDGDTAELVDASAHVEAEDDDESRRDAAEISIDVGSVPIRAWHDGRLDCSATSTRRTVCDSVDEVVGVAEGG